MIYEQLVELIGTPPAGLEPVIYVMAAIVLLFLVMSAMSLIGAVIKWIGGR